jgi:hypothetical protein
LQRLNQRGQKSGQKKSNPDEIEHDERRAAGRESREPDYSLTGRPAIVMGGGGRQFTEGSSD